MMTHITPRINNTTPKILISSPPRVNKLNQVATKQRYLMKLKNVTLIFGEYNTNNFKNQARL
jgi:hypothetical protein